MTEHNIGVRESASLIVIMTCAKIFLGMPRRMVELGGTAAWAVVLLSAVHGLVIWWLLRGILRLGIGRSLVTATEAVMGPWVGTAFNLAYSIYFAALGVTVLREFAEGMVLIFLPTTPLPVVVLTLLLTGLFIAYLGLEAATRVAWLGGPAMLAGYILLLLASVKTHAEPYALAPYWGTGLIRVVSGGLTENLFGEVLIFGLFATGFRSEKEFNAAIKWTVVLSCAILVVSEIVYLYVFPYPTGARVVLPMMQVTRAISLGPGVQRVESGFFVIWLVASILKMAAAMLGSVTALTETLRLPHQRYLLVPLTVLGFSVALIPLNNTEVVMWDVFLRQYGGLVTIMLPAVTLGVGKLVRRRGAGHAA